MIFKNRNPIVLIFCSVLLLCSYILLKYYNTDSSRNKRRISGEKNQKWNPGAIAYQLGGLGNVSASVLPSFQVASLPQLMCLYVHSIQHRIDTQQAAIIVWLILSRQQWHVLIPFQRFHQSLSNPAQVRTPQCLTVPNKRKEEHQYYKDTIHYKSVNSISLCLFQNFLSRNPTEIKEK